MSLTALLAATAFNDLDEDGSGSISPDELKGMLERFDITMTPGQFWDMVHRIDTNGDGEISYAEFLSFFNKGHTEKDALLKKVDKISVAKAVTMIRTKILERVESGPAGLRRCFSYFDADGSGAIDLAEFRDALARKANLQFEDALLARIIKQFDPQNTGEINFASFSELVMGSTKGDHSSVHSVRPSGCDNMVSADSGNSVDMIKRKVRIAWKDLRNAFRAADENCSGCLDKEELRDVLFRFDIILAAHQFDELIDAIDVDGDGQVSFAEFLQFFGTGHVNINTPVAPSAVPEGWPSLGTTGWALPINKVGKSGSFATEFYCEPAKLRLSRIHF